MKKIVQTLAILSGIFLPLSSDLSATAQPNGCSDLIKECFVYQGQERDNCFRSASEHRACDRSEAGSLAAKRSQFAPLNTGSAAAGPSFLGAQMIDTQCLANFDNAWSGALIRGPLRNEAYRELGRELQGCARSPASDTIRP